MFDKGQFGLGQFIVWHQSGDGWATGASIVTGALSGFGVQMTTRQTDWLTDWPNVERVVETELNQGQRTKRRRCCAPLVVSEPPGRHRFAFQSRCRTDPIQQTHRMVIFG